MGQTKKSKKEKKPFYEIRKDVGLGRKLKKGISGNECCPYHGTFIVPIFDDAVFKVRTADYAAVLYAEMPRGNIAGLMSRH